MSRDFRPYLSGPIMNRLKRFCKMFRFRKDIRSKKLSNNFANCLSLFIRGPKYIFYTIDSGRKSLDTVPLKPYLCLLQVSKLTLIHFKWLRNTFLYFFVNVRLQGFRKVVSEGGFDCLARCLRLGHVPGHVPPPSPSLPSPPPPPPHLPPHYYYYYVVRTYTVRHDQLLHLCPHRGSL